MNCGCYIDWICLGVLPVLCEERMDWRLLGLCEEDVYLYTHPVLLS
jgi:hypothetical protein